MKFSSLQIQRFGGWSHLDLDRFACGMNVVYGAPGSGKGAIVDFLVAMLYGHPRPPRHTAVKRNVYQALDGALALEVAGQRQVVRRQTRNRGLSVAPRAEGRNSQQEMQSLLATADRATFEQIYSIDFRRLRSIVPLLREACRAGCDLTPEADATHALQEPTATENTLWQDWLASPNQREVAEARREELRSRIRTEESRRRQSDVLKQQLAALDKAIDHHRQALGHRHHGLGRVADASFRTSASRRSSKPAFTLPWIEGAEERITRWLDLLKAVRSEYVPTLWLPSAEPKQTLDELWAAIDQIRHETSRLASPDGNPRRRKTFQSWIPTLSRVRRELARLRKAIVHGQNDTNSQQTFVTDQRLREVQSDASLLLGDLEGSSAESDLAVHSEPPSGHVTWDEFIDDPAHHDWPTGANTDHETYSTKRARHEYELKQLVTKRERIAAGIDNGCDEAALARHRAELRNLEAELQNSPTGVPAYHHISVRLQAIEHHLRQTMQPLDTNPLTRAASQTLSQLTGGVYERLWISHDSMLWVEGRTDRARIPYAHLSRTERCLVYISIALSIVSARRRAGRHLPLIVNDEDLNLDLQQATALYDALNAEAHDGQQVFLFTTHRPLLDKEQASATRLFELQDPRKTNIQFETIAAPASSQPTWIPLQQSQSLATASPQPLHGHTLRPRDPLPAIPYLSDSQAHQLQASGIRTVEDFQRCTPSIIARHLAPWNVSSQLAARWLTEVKLLVELRTVHARESQWLYSAGIRSVADLADMEIDELVRRITSSNVVGPGPQLGESEAAALRTRARHWIQDARELSDRVSPAAAGFEEPAHNGFRNQKQRNAALAWSESSPIASLPWLSPSDTDALHEVGIDTVGDLVRLDLTAPTSYGRLGLQHRLVQQWQAAAEFGCRIPGIDPAMARQLADCGVRGVSHLARLDTDSLSRRLRQVAGRKRSDRAHQVSRAELAAWIGAAQDRGRPRPPQTTWSDRHPWADSLRRALEREALRSRGIRDAEREAVGPTSRRKRQRSKPRQQTNSDRPASLRFYLRRSDNVVEAPAIGGKTAEQLAVIGIRTVDDLLCCEPAEVAERLDHKRITENRIRDWQTLATLVCQVPFLRGHDAQILLAIGIRESEQLAAATPSRVWQQIQPLLKSNQGRRILRGGKQPDLNEVTHWIEWAQQARTLKAA